MITKANRISLIAPYAFAQVDRMVSELRKKGINPIDFGVGDPLDPTPKFILNTEKKALEKHKKSGYPSYIGLEEFRRSISHWMKKRFGVSLDPNTEITSNIGSKEGIFHFPFGFINPGDYVLMPSPGYPPYKTGTIFSGGIPYYYPILKENDFYPDFDSFPKKILKKTKILWLNYPNSPTGKLATKKFYKKAIEFAEKHNIIIASDECYSEIYFEKKPYSILEFGQKNIIVFQSLSKRSCMTGHRIGFACGDAKIIETFRQVKTNIDSGTPNFIQEGAIAALSDEKHVKKSRIKYQEKRDILIKALSSLGLKTEKPESTFYIWQEVPSGETSLSFAKKLLHENIAIVITPGEWISEICNYKGENIHPGGNYIRFALVPEKKDVILAAKRLKKLKKLRTI